MLIRKNAVWDAMLFGLFQKKHNLSLENWLTSMGHSVSVVNYVSLEFWLVYEVSS